MKTRLEWMRAKCREKNGFQYRRFESRCRRFAVEHSRYMGNGLPDKWRALEWVGGGWSIISGHTKRGPAEAACQKRARQLEQEARKNGARYDEG